MHRVKVIVPITGKDEDSIKKEVRVISGTDVDVVEWRFDLTEMAAGLSSDVKPVDTVVKSLCEKVRDILKLLKESMHGKEILFTIRTKKQGGEFPNQPELYEMIVGEAVKSGYVDYVDIEDTTEQNASERIIGFARKNKVRTIASFHDFDATPEGSEIIRKFEKLRDMGADIIKTAYMPVKPVDVAALLYATARFKEEDQGRHELITMSMGDLGRVSRVSGAVFGSDYTFAAVGETSAPGQMPIATVREIMKALDMESTEGGNSGNLYLIGFMASGKSTVSAKLSERTGKPVFEMDQYIVDKMGMSIAEIFEKFGEDRFREIETETLSEIRPDSGAIISTGGGAPMRADNRKAMHEQGKVFYLSVRPETVIKRLSVNQTERPVLAGHVDINYVTDLLGKRDPIYRKAADVILETDDMTVDEICDEIIRNIESCS